MNMMEYHIAEIDKTMKEILDVLKRIEKSESTQAKQFVKESRTNIKAVMKQLNESKKNSEGNLI